MISAVIATVLSVFSILRFVLTKFQLATWIFKIILSCHDNMLNNHNMNIIMIHVVCFIKIILLLRSSFIILYTVLIVEVQYDIMSLYCTRESTVSEACYHMIRCDT